MDTMHNKKHLHSTMVREFATTLKLMKAFPSDQQDFKPHERSNSALMLFRTFVIELWIIEGAFGSGIDPEKMKYMPENLSQAIQDFEKVSQQILDIIAAASEEEMTKKGEFFGNPMTPGEVAEFMLLDQIHHRGQLSVYIRMAGGKVPSIYGPSADEPWEAK
jgi:uncharacterized damage-inducible protein DinB